MHLEEEDLILRFYGELDDAGEARVERHLGECPACRGNYTRLQRVLAAVDTMPEPVLPEAFERVTWARLEPALGRHSTWRSWFAFSGAKLALASVVLVLVTGAFFAGRMTREPSPGGAASLTADQLRKQILLTDLNEHLDRSQMMLIDLVSAADDSSIDMALERERAEELVVANRLYRQTADETGEGRVSELLDELERLLVDLAASPDTLSQEEMTNVRQRIDSSGLLFKVRVLSSTLRERQKQQIRTRTASSD